jgi:NAD(P)-dependent dehydrogenase (short-subunit alcohol dehydrogenase family)
MPVELRNKAIVITGAFGALGVATARAAVRSGARVALIDRVEKTPEELVALCDSPPHIMIRSVNLSDSSEAAAAVEKAAAHLSGVDVLINIAGAFRWQTVVSGDPEVWGELYAINFKTALNCSHAALAHLRQSSQGRVINIGALAAQSAAAGMGPYTASKAAVHRLTESLADELRNESITVNAVMPSIIDTPANRSGMPDADYSKWTTAAALADVLMFLASNESQAITGALIPVTGWSRPPH